MTAHASVEDASFTADDGQHLHATVAGDGPLVVVLPPLTGTAANCIPWQLAMDSRFTVAALTPRGVGASSPARDAAAHTFERYADDVIDLMASLGFETASLVGASFGAGLSLAVALADPTSVEALVLLGGAHAGAELGWLPGQEPLREAADEAAVSLDGAIAVAERIIGPEPDDEARGTLWRSHDRPSLGLFVAGGLSQPYAAIDDLAAIDVPALVSPGADTAHPVELSRRWADVMPRARYVELMAGGVDIDLLVSTTDDFLAEVVLGR